MVTTSLCCYSVKTYYGVPLNSTKSELVSELVELGLEATDENSYFGTVYGYPMMVTFKTDSRNGIKEVTEVFKVKDRSEAIERLLACRNTVNLYHDDAVENDLENGFLYLVDGGKAAILISMELIDDEIFIFYISYNGLPAIP